MPGGRGLGLAAVSPTAQAAPSTGSIAGTVTNASHTGLVGIDVMVFQADGTGYWNYVDDTNTVSGGSYVLSGLSAGAYRVELYDDNGVYLMQCYANKASLDLAADVVVTAGATTPAIDASLVKGGEIVGTVTDASLQGLSDIDVTAYRGDGSGGWNYVNDVTTGDDGSYDLGGLAGGTYRVEFDDYSGTYQSQCYANKANLDAATDVTVAAGATTSGINATLGLAGHIKGIVTDANHADLGDISVTAYRSDGQGGWTSFMGAYTHDDGAYDLGGLSSGTYRIRFRDGSGDYQTQYYFNKPTIDAATDVTIVAPATTPNIDATLADAAHVTGTVTNASGHGLGNVAVSAYQPDGSGGWTDVSDTSTSSGGGYDLSGLTSGTCRLQFSDNSGAYGQQWYSNKPSLALADSVTVNAGVTTSNINVTLAAGGHITGTVTDTNHAGLSDIYVTAYQADQGSWDFINQSYTDNAGGYDIAGLAAGEYRLEFADFDGGVYATQYFDNEPSLDLADDVAVSAGVPTQNVNATLTPLSRSDTVAPTTTASGTDGLWHNAAVTVTLTAVDNSGGSGVGLTEYRALGDSAWLPYTAPLVISAQGSSTYQYRSIDTAQNAELAKSFVVKVDTTRPTTTASGLQAKANTAWQRTGTVTLSANDAPSSVAGTYFTLDGGPTLTYGAPIAITAQGSNTISYWAVDAAGNASVAQTGYVSIDSKPPAATVKAMSVTTAAAKKGKTLKVKVTIADAKPGCGAAKLVLVLTSAKNKKLATLTFKSEPTNKALTLSDKLAKSLTKGSYYLTVNATDSAGNAQVKVARAKLTVK